MDSQKAAENLQVIRQLMERPVRCSTQSGLSGILAGCITLAGVAADSYFSGRFRPIKAFWINLAVWGAVFFTALIAALVLMRLRELKQGGMPFWTPAKRKMLTTILPSFVAGAGLSLAIAYRWYFSIGPNQFGLIVPLWMLFYGIACWQVGEITIPEIRVMGAAFILAGLISACFFQADIPGLAPGTAPYVTMGLTFGGFHILYGIVVWVRHGG